MTQDMRTVQRESQAAPVKHRRKLKPATLKPEVSEVKQENRLREALMKSALRLFTQRGYSATTVREIVGAAGATKPVLYYYFGAKRAFSWS